MDTKESQSPEEVAIYDPDRFRAALNEDVTAARAHGAFDQGRIASDAPVRTFEEDIRARCLHKILDDPRGATRRKLLGDRETAERLLAVSATMPHFAAVTGIIYRAVLQSALTGREIRFPPILMVSPPGLGKTYYCKRIAAELATTCVPIAVNGTSDRGQLGGLSTLWRGAKIGKLAKGLIVDSNTAAPLFLLDEIDKPPALMDGERTLDVLLAALEPVNAVAFVDEYIDAPVNLASALWIASANDIDTIPAPLLDRMLVVHVPRPSRDQSRLTAAAISRSALAEAMLVGVKPEALELLLDLSPRRLRRTVEVACGFAVCARRGAVTMNDVRRALALTEANQREYRVGFLS